MNKKRFISGVLLVVFMAFGLSVFAQTTTLKVMKNGVVVFQSEVLEIEKMVFQDPSGSPAAPSNDALVVNKSDDSPADKTLLDNIEQLTFSDVNMLVESVGSSNSVYPFGNITKLTFDKMTTGISNPQAQSPEVIVYVNSEGNIEVESEVEIKSLKLFTIDGKTIATVDSRHAKSLPSPPAGMYLLAVETIQGTVIKKIVKY